MAKLKEFQVTAEGKFRVTVPIKAASLEDAVAQAREMKITDFVTPEGDQCFDDCEHEIVGVWS